jgi:hypothetical protein
LEWWTVFFPICRSGAWYEIMSRAGDCWLATSNRIRWPGAKVLEVGQTSIQNSWTSPGMSLSTGSFGCQRAGRGRTCPRPRPYLQFVYFTSDNVPCYSPGPASFHIKSICNFDFDRGLGNLKEIKDSLLHFRYRIEGEGDEPFPIIEGKVKVLFTDYCLRVTSTSRSPSSETSQSTYDPASAGRRYGDVDRRARDKKATVGIVLRCQL